MQPEPYIPLRVTDLIDVLLNEAGTPESPALPLEEHAPFREFAGAVSHRVENGYRSLFRIITDAYAPFDPDLETLRLRELTEDRHYRLDNLFQSFTLLLERGGFHRLTRPELEATMQGASYWGIEMDVCWEVFNRVEVFVRGRGLGWRTRRVWWRFFKREDVELPTFRRVVMIMKQQPHKRLGSHADTHNVFLKIFKNIPTMDVEMLLPGTRLRMPKLERGKLGGTAIFSLLWLGWKLIPILATGILAGGVLALLTPIFLILGYSYKTVYRFHVSKKNYMLQLTQSLYYQNLDSNAGVLYRLFHEAAEQDTRQALLAYYFLWRFGGKGWTAKQLDDAIEKDLERRVGSMVEVDTDSALVRLKRFQTVEQVGEQYTAVPIRQAIDAVRTTKVITESHWHTQLMK